MAKYHRGSIMLPPLDPDFELSDYRRAVDFLETTYPPAVIKLGLQRITRLLEMLGRPQDAFPSIIVAGTNGKGSTCAFLESILIQAGLRIGTNLSPHLEHPTERIRVGGNDIAPGKFGELILNSARLIDRLWDDSERPTYHELLTAAALVHFAECKIDLAILEVGLGGRFDAANAVDAPLAIITPIGLDHTDRLGSDLASIAKEKAAVVRPGATVVCARQAPEAADAIKATLDDVNAGRFLQPSGDSTVYFQDSRFHAELHIENIGLRRIPLGIAGACQPANARLAVMAANALRDLSPPHAIDCRVNEATIERGLSNARLPGRFEILRREPMLVLDGAHNAPGAECLDETLRSMPADAWMVVLGMKADKDAHAFISRISPHIHALITCPIPDIKSYEPEALADIASSVGVPAECIQAAGTPGAALDRAFAGAEGGTPILITGSLYLVGRMRSLLRPTFDDAA